MSHCPSCGRFVGPYDACPHCGAALSGRSTLRALKLAALVLAVGGLALLWLLATRTDVPTVAISQINAMMNMAYVRVQGRVSQPPSYDPETGYLSFWLQDDTGELRAVAYQNESQALIERGRVPALGDRVALEGTLRVREDYASLTLNLPERLALDRDPPAERSIGEVGAADALRRVRVRGQVRAVRSPYDGLTLVGLRDATGEIELAIPEVTTLLGDELPDLSGGAAVEVVAPVSLYKGTPQLSLARAADLTLLDEPLALAPQSPIGQIDAGRAGGWATLSGRVTEVTPFSAGVKCRLEDGSGQITLLLWQSLYDRLTDAGRPAVGSRLRVQGELAEYRGELEIVPELPADVAVLAPPPAGVAAVATPTPTPPPTVTAPATTPATSTPTPRPSAPATPTRLPATATPTPTASPTPQPTDTPAPVILPIGELDAARSSQEIAVRGRVVDAASFSQGFKFTLDDGSGRIVLLMWHDVYDECWDAPQLNLGATVQAEGELGQYEGSLQIVPGRGGDVRVTAPGGPAAPLREIGSLGADLGGRVSVIGQITRVEGTDSGARIFVADDTGELLIFIWNNVLERVPDNESLGTPGTRVQVAGRLQEYRGQLELVPALPYDVQVLP